MGFSPNAAGNVVQQTKDISGEQHADGTYDVAKGASFRSSQANMFGGKQESDIAAAIGIPADQLFVKGTSADKNADSRQFTPEAKAALEAGGVTQIGAARTSATKGMIYGSDESGAIKTIDDYDMPVPDMFIDKVLPMIAMTLFTSGMGSAVGAAAAASAGGGAAGTIASMAGKALTGAALSAAGNDGRINPASMISAFIPTNLGSGVANLAAGAAKSIGINALTGGKTIDIDGAGDNTAMNGLKAMYDANQSGNFSQFTPNQIGGTIPDSVAGSKSTAGGAPGNSGTESVTPGIATQPPATSSVSQSREPPPIAKLLMMLIQKQQMGGMPMPPTGPTMGIGGPPGPIQNQIAPVAPVKG